MTRRRSRTTKRSRVAPSSRPRPQPAAATKTRLAERDATQPVASHAQDLPGRHVRVHAHAGVRRSPRHTADAAHTATDPAGRPTEPRQRGDSSRRDEPVQRRRRPSKALQHQSRPPRHAVEAGWRRNRTRIRCRQTGPAGRRGRGHSTAPEKPSGKSQVGKGQARARSAGAHGQSEELPTGVGREHRTLPRRALEERPSWRAALVETPRRIRRCRPA